MIWYISVKLIEIRNYKTSEQHKMTIFCRFEWLFNLSSKHNFVEIQKNDHQIDNTGYKCHNNLCTNEHGITT